MRYFVMECEGDYPTTSIEESPDLDEPPWMHGGIVSNPGAILEYTLDGEPGGILKAMYGAPEYPIIRDDLIEALEAAGVDNLQLFDALLTNPEDGVRHTNYKAFNIVGVIAAADPDGSEQMGTSDSEMIDVDFDSLMIDEAKVAGAKFFRLAESVNAIIASDDVRQAVEARGIPGMIFYDPADWSG